VDIGSGYFLSILSPEKIFPLSTENCCNTLLSDSYAFQQKAGTSLAISSVKADHAVVKKEKKLTYRQQPSLPRGWMLPRETGKENGDEGV
jgi:hypothetical protein